MGCIQFVVGTNVKSQSQNNYACNIQKHLLYFVNATKLAKSVNLGHGNVYYVCRISLRIRRHSPQLKLKKGGIL